MPNWIIKNLNEIKDGKKKEWFNQISVIKKKKGSIVYENMYIMNDIRMEGWVDWYTFLEKYVSDYKNIFFQF